MLRPYTSRNTENPPSLETLKYQIEQVVEWYLNFYKEVSKAEFQKKLTFEFLGDDKGQMSHQEIILHLINHATYHRGFISDMLYQIPFSPTANDLPVFLRDIWNK